MTLKEGDSFPLNCGSIATVIRYVDSYNVHIKTSTGYSRIVEAGCLRKGKVNDLLNKNIYGIGFIGVGSATPKDPSYDRWKNIMFRCYSGSLKSYEGVSVCEEWHDFQSFSKWFKDNNIEGFEIDKDLKLYNNKIYSPDTCLFIPKRINKFFIKRASTYGLPHVVNYCGDGYASKIRAGSKTVRTVKEAQIDYWDQKRKEMDCLIAEFPDFKGLIAKSFQSFINDKFTIHNTQPQKV